jgi:hypothetical protein
MQALGRIAQIGWVFSFNPTAHMQPEGFVFQQVQILCFAWFDHVFSLR